MTLKNIIMLLSKVLHELACYLALTESGWPWSCVLRAIISYLIEANNWILRTARAAPVYMILCFHRHKTVYVNELESV